MRSMALVVLALAGLAWSKSKDPADPGTAAGAQLRYGAPIQLGKGEARTYVLRDRKTGEPTEVGIALTEGALQGLPEAGQHGGNGHEHYAAYILELPANHGTPYRFVELDWNPKGHGGPYTAQHFDFHFYAVPEELVWEIPFATPPLPAVPADRLPPGYTQPGVSEAEMGRHSAPAWTLFDPGYLTTVMIAGFLPDASNMHFIEPMVSRERLLERTDFELPVPIPAVLGHATRYAYDNCSEPESPSAELSAGAELDLATCRTCDLRDYCTEEDSGDDDCFVDEEGRVSLPD